MPRIARYCHAAGIRLVSDEIYHGIVYGMAASDRAREQSTSAIVVNSFSKYFSMTGWRIGWMVVPPDMAARRRMPGAESLHLAAVAVAARGARGFRLRATSSTAMSRAMRANRALLLEELPKAGFERFAPADGAFYLYADVAHLTNDSREFCRRMLRETGVACTPGIDFDPARGHAHAAHLLRRRRPQTMAEAARRLKDWRR